MRSGPSRRGVTLLELVIASSMLAVIATSLSLVLRTARTAWEVNDRDYGAMHHAHTVARHFVRQAREATAVTSLPSGAKTISLRLRDGTDLSWSHAASLGGRNNVVVVTFPGSGDQIPLAYDISNLSFTGYKADGLTKTTNVDDVRLVEIAVTVTLPNNSSTQQTVVSKVWIRAW